MKKKKDNSAKAIIISLAIVSIVLIVLSMAGKTESFAGTKIGYTSQKGRSYWSATYETLDGKASKSIYPKEGIIAITAETLEGSIDILVESEGEVIFSGEDLQSGHTHIQAEGKVDITVTARNHKGSFTFDGTDNGHEH